MNHMSDRGIMVIAGKEKTVTGVKAVCERGKTAFCPKSISFSAKKNGSPSCQGSLVDIRTRVITSSSSSSLSHINPLLQHHAPMDTHPPATQGVGNPLVPLVALAAALIKAILYLLNIVRLLVAFLTITIPTQVFSLREKYMC